MRFKRYALYNSLLFLGVSLLLVFAWYQGYRWNTSVSYPPGIYRLDKTPATLTIGDLVLFCPPDSPVLQTAVKRDYLKRGDCPGNFQPVIKKVMAEPGTHVSLQGVVSLNGVPVKDATVRISDGSGRPLPQLPDFIVPPGTFFLMSDHAPSVSFDSRYYGSVPQKNILGHIHPVWISD